MSKFANTNNPLLTKRESKKVEKILKKRITDTFGSEKSMRLSVSSSRQARKFSTQLSDLKKRTK